MFKPQSAVTKSSKADKRLPWSGECRPDGGVTDCGRETMEILS